MSDDCRYRELVSVYCVIFIVRSGKENIVQYTDVIPLRPHHESGGDRAQSWKTDNGTGYPIDIRGVAPSHVDRISLFSNAPGTLPNRRPHLTDDPKSLEYLYR